MNHLESLIAEFLDWKGYLVKRNIHVGALAHGGYAMELDVLAFHPHTKHFVHYEPSTDADSWAERELRFSKKFTNARKYALDEVFTWLPKDTELEQVAVCVTHPPERHTLGGGTLMSLDELMAIITGEILRQGVARRNAISESYPLLRTIQLTVCGYNGLRPNLNGRP